MLWILGMLQAEFQYRQRYQEGYNSRLGTARIKIIAQVSIPTTVSGGLQ